MKHSLMTFRFKPINNAFLSCIKTGIALTYILSSTPVLAASFDCKNASINVEQWICNTPSLSLLDSHLSTNYQLAMANLPLSQATTLRNQQRAWIKTRNACDNLHCLQLSLEQRSREIQQSADEAMQTLDAIIRSIPSDPSTAARKLKNYNDPLAFAWLVYLHQFEPSSKLTNAESEQYYQQAVDGLNDPYTRSLFDDIKNAPTTNRNRLILTLLRMTIETHGYREVINGKEREYSHCFIFKRQGKDAYDTFGSLYGSTRDSWAPICSPQGNLFQQSAWKQLSELMQPMIDKASENSGTIRFASYADWNMFNLHVSVSPTDFLVPDSSAKTTNNIENEILAWNDKEWPKAERNVVLNAMNLARQETAQWLMTEQHLSETDAALLANTIVQHWLSLRLDFIGVPEA